mmetsp:Transcript_106846/g.319435  ORF Transcript_106846/g.319435 Transcript_106846/m.319435 type:complete len:91 (+) Transcript_106846:771-1043(+)
MPPGDGTGRALGPLSSARTTVLEVHCDELGTTGLIPNTAVPSGAREETSTEDPVCQACTRRLCITSCVPESDSTWTGMEVEADKVLTCGA